MSDDRSSPLFTRRSFFAAAALLLVLVACLHLEGRIPWGAKGLGLWSAAWTETTSQNLIDPYTLSHFLHGVIAYWILRPLPLRLSSRLILAMALEIGWEVLENS